MTTRRFDVRAGSTATVEKSQRPGRPVARQAQGRAGWYRIDNLGPTSAAVYVYDEIGYWGITAADFVAELSELNVTAIDLHINSPGGEVFDGLAIMNCLRAHSATVTTYVDGLAASIASVIAMAGDQIVMGPHSQLMIHEGSGLCIGDADEMRKMADLLDFQSNNIAGVYAARAGGTIDEWRTAMRTETWYTAEEAVTAGLADEVAQRPATAAPAEPEPAMAARWDPERYGFRYSGRPAAPAPPLNTTPVEPAPAEPEPVVEPAAPEPVTPVVPAAEALPETPSTPAASPADADEDPAGADGTPEPAPAPATTPEDPEWTGLTARLVTPPTTDDVFARLKEALL